MTAVWFNTETLVSIAPPWGMSPQLISADLYSASRRVEHKIREVAMGVACMAELENAQGTIAPMIQELIEALRSEAREHAGATRPPKLPQWATSLLVALSATFATAMVAGLIGYGALQQRVSNLEASHPESISSLATKIDMLNSRMEDIQRRFNDLVDGRAVRRPQ